MKTLSIIGAGRVGQTLARLWHEQGVFHIHEIVNQTPASSIRAIDWIGAGSPLADSNSLGTCDLVLISTPDRMIETVAHRLRVQPDTIVFHVSGALDSRILSSAAGITASIHPSLSFASPNLAIHQFKGTVCALEGHAYAQSILRDAFERIGGHVIQIDPRHKTLYHAAAVMACNLLVPLVQDSLTLLKAAGIDESMGRQMLAPLMMSTIDNIRRLRTPDALTGPLVRGDDAVIKNHLDRLQSDFPDIHHTYVDLSRKAIALLKENQIIVSSELETLFTKK